MNTSDTAALVAAMLVVIGRLQILAAATDGSYRMNKQISAALVASADAIVAIDARLNEIEARLRRLEQ